jgi:UDP-N-acetylglucosamine 2-epimerase (non-hydrolysing)
MTRPFPEEFNRRAISPMATWHFAPTPAAAANLVREGIPRRRVFCVGNTVVDAISRTVRADYKSPLIEGASRLVLFTAHRRELTGDEINGLFSAVFRLAEHFPDVRVLYPVHPRLRAAAERALAGTRVCLLAPLSTADCHNLMARATLLLTDSGGMQEEACALSLPTLVLRRESERGEGIAAGILRLVGTGEEAVYTAAANLLSSPDALARMRGGKNPYGDGRAAVRIARILRRELAGGGLQKQRP